MSSPHPLNTRMAPAPTGRLHLGTARTAIFNWLAARSTSGKFYLRIDDTNPALCEERYVDEIKVGLEWLGLDWDREYRQSSLAARMKYESYIGFLQKQNRVIEENGALRLNYDHGIHSWNDFISGKIVVSEQLATTAKSTVLLTSDGRYSYHFASVISDEHMGVDFVIRGSDHMNNTVRQLALCDACEISRPQFAHVGLITQGTKKMSKSDAGSRVNLLDLRDAGYSPEAVFSFLVRLGWAPTIDNKENAYITRDRALEMFLTEGRMKYKNANADMVKLEWYDRKSKSQSSPN